MTRFDRVVLVLCVISMVFSVCRAIMYSHTRAKPQELPRIVQLCFDNTDRYYTSNDYR